VNAAALLADLDDEQRRAVTAAGPIVAVIAGAGSGKTRVLTRRIAYRVATDDAEARHVLALTFTREAAGELRRRLRALGLRDHVEAGTFHSVALSTLRQRWADVGRRAPTVTSDRRRLVAQATRPELVGIVTSEIDWARALAIRPEMYVAEARRAGRRPGVALDAVASAFADYELTKRRRGVIDLDDVLSLLVQEITRDRDFAEVVRWKHRHIHVDEAQDLNPVQHRLIDLLRHGRDDLFLVGDPSQAIYAFNGTDPALLVEVATRFPGVEVVRLPTNHRSTPEIVAAGSHVLAVSGQPAPLASGRPEGASVAAERLADERAEVAAVVDLARRYAGSRGSMAVLARTNAQLTPFATALGRAGIAVTRRADAEPGLRAAIAEATALGSAARLRDWAHEILDGEPPDAIDRLDEAPARRVAAAVLEFLRDHPRGDGAALRTWLVTSAAFDDDTPAGGVELLTFHAAKGREWATVAVTGVETGLVPHASARHPDQVAEEARLLYVALTRATDRLVVLSAQRRDERPTVACPWTEALPSCETPSVAPPAELRRGRRTAGDARSDDDAALDRLVAWRQRAARAAGIEPAVLCRDRDLAAIAAHRPASPAELDALIGCGSLTAARLFPAIGRVLADAGDQSPMSTTTGA
jgi:DNA helicase-2/ATP-dependent DNA helicase PcrA